jgi:hypothetical protein
MWLLGGNIVQGEMTPDRMFSLRSGLAHAAPPLPAAIPRNYPSQSHRPCGARSAMRWGGMVPPARRYRGCHETAAGAVATLTLLQR